MAKLKPKHPPADAKELENADTQILPPKHDPHLAEGKIRKRGSKPGQTEDDRRVPGTIDQPPPFREPKAPK